MCLFIAAVLPQTALTGAFAEVAARHRVGTVPLANTSVLQQMHRYERVVLTTRGHCDCGSPLFQRAKERSPQRVRREIVRLKKKGWSAARIEKWIAATEPPREPSSRQGVLTLQQWAVFLEEALSLSSTRYVGLCGHWFSGDLSAEKVILSGRQQRSIEALLVRPSETLQEDTVYEFVQPSAG